jgi:hypothetical protein
MGKNPQHMVKIQNAAKMIGVPWQALAAVVKVESAGHWFAEVEGRKEPLIRFEGHYFDRLLDLEDRDRARAMGLASPKAGAIRNPRRQSGRWHMLRQAQSIDRSAALQSTSWGIGQVMGANWQLLAYSSVESLVLDARSGAAGQLRLMTRFIEQRELTGALRDLDFTAFARVYNGPNFARYGYDQKMRQAYNDLIRSESFHLPAHENRNFLFLGDRGLEVCALQAALRQTGKSLTPDCDFGPQTLAAVIQFQQDNGLEPDGKAGPETQRALVAWQHAKTDLKHSVRFGHCAKSWVGLSSRHGTEI